MDKMEIYADPDTGAYLGHSNKKIEGAVAVPIAPSDARQIWSFEIESWGGIPDDRTPSEKRADAYRNEIGIDDSFETTVGDCLDALLKFAARDNPAANNDPDLGPLLDKVRAIKDRYPAE
ncbi:MAG: hypothetical protein V7727_18260 [Sneathiella sp.]